MQSTLDAPLVTAGTGISATPTQRPLGCMRGIGFIPDIWVTQALKRGLFPTPRSHSVAVAIAEAADPDGRWCFKYLDSLARDLGLMLGKRTVQRAVQDLLAAGIVRKLDPGQTLAFFSEQIATGRRWPTHLPCVLELCIPAQDYPEPVLAEINEVRAALGEEPLDERTRPPLHPRPKKHRPPARSAPACPATPGAGTATPATTKSNKYPTLSDVSGQLAQHPWSGGPTNSSFTDSSSTGAGTSVRGTSTSGLDRGPHALIAQIPDALLTNAATDRQALSQAVDALAAGGLPAEQIGALLSGADRLRKPFPALKSRLSSLERARAFLEGSLGLGVDRASRPPPLLRAHGPAPDHDQEGFALDPRGRAARTCPDHPGVRNEPGGTCGVCARPCRTGPGQSPPQAPVPAPRALSPAEPGRQGPAHEVEVDPDPELVRLMFESLEHTRANEPASPHQGPPRHPGARQNTIDELRQRLDRARDERRTRQRPGRLRTPSAQAGPAGADPPRRPERGANVEAPSTHEGTPR